MAFIMLHLLCLMVIICNGYLEAISPWKAGLAHLIEETSIGYTSIKDPNSYTFVYVHVWSNTMDNVNDVVNKLNKNSKVRIVSPDTFIKLIINNVPHVDI